MKSFFGQTFTGADTEFATTEHSTDRSASKPTANSTNAGPPSPFASIALFAVRLGPSFETFPKRIRSLVEIYFNETPVGFSEISGI